MSEPKLITPLLANHIMGDPISEHHGVRCCPAMLKDSDNKYIVKIISIPASPVQLEALLLSGAYSNREAALAYFKSLADATVEEARILEKLFRLEGFHAYPSWQVEPMEDGAGYDVYLLGEYNMTLERYLRRNSLTHLAAVNLGLDICSALAVSRRNGYLYVDLKPENIFITPNGEYRIGDLGFINLKSLKYASLPDKYHSAYTAPEITDAFSSLNTTLDVYALGLILYQAFNEGKLPQPDEELTSPIYADYEMAEIILKACAVNPEDRWQDPQQMGQALVSYMQRNTVNDTPIIPAPIPEPELPAEDEAEEVPQELEEQVEEMVDPESSMEEVNEDSAISEKSVEEIEEEPAASEEPLEEIEEEPAASEEPLEEAEEESAASEEPVNETAEESPNSEEAVEEAEKTEVPVDESEEAEAEDESDDLEQFIIDGFDADDTLPAEADTVDVDVETLSEEVGEILAQADELIAHKAPDPVKAPEPVEIPMPEPILPETEPEAVEETAEEASEPTEETDEPQPEESQEEPEQKDEVVTPEVPAPAPKKKLRGLVGVLIAVLITLLIAVGAFYYYENYYLQHIYDIEIETDEDHMTLRLDTPIDNSLLTVYLTDIYGNTLKKPVVDNCVEFTSLSAATAYSVHVEIDGYHKLIGKTTASFTTAAETNIVSFNAIAGDSDGSVILNFSVQGPDNTNWFVKYSAEGIPEQTALCTGHMATITGLEVGKLYTFRLVPEADLYVVGTDTLQYTALPVIYAEDLTIHGFDSGCLSVTWKAPEGITVNSWTVRCYNTDGFDTTFTVTEPQALIEIPDVSLGYTVDVKAEGMSVSKWTSVSAGSVTFKTITFDESVPGKLTVNWDYEGTAPADGWMLMYSVDGSEKYIVKSETNSCTISPVVPGGNYSISFVLPEDITVFGGTATYTVGKKNFSGYGVKKSDFSFVMCPTPEEIGWIWYDVWEGYYTNTFVTGEKASLIVYLDSKFEKSKEEVPTLFVLRNSDGIPVSISEGRCRTWSSMWVSYHTELDLPVTPTAPGKYTVDIYFSNQHIGSVSFTIVAEESTE